MEILAQFVVNILAFVLLLLILKKFAWGSLLKLIDDRRAKITSEFESIERTRAELEQLKIVEMETMKTVFGSYDGGPEW